MLRRVELAVAAEVEEAAQRVWAQAQVSALGRLVRSIWASPVWVRWVWAVSAQQGGCQHLQGWPLGSAVAVSLHQESKVLKKWWK